MVSDTFDGLYGKCSFPAGTLVLGAWTKIYGLTARPRMGFSIGPWGASILLESIRTEDPGAKLRSKFDIVGGRGF